MDFFTVPTLTFQTLYCFFVIEHYRRRIAFQLHCASTSLWIVQQLREALPLPRPYRYVLFDWDAKVGNDVFEFLTASGTDVNHSAEPMAERNRGAMDWQCSS